jgi:hypothetical protein
LHESVIGPERVKTPGLWELTKPISAQVAAGEVREHKRQITTAHIAQAQQPHAGVTPASPS